MIVVIRFFHKENAAKMARGGGEEGMCAINLENEEKCKILTSETAIYLDRLLSNIY